MFGRSVDVFVTDLRSVAANENLLSVGELGEALALGGSPELNEYVAVRSWLRIRLADYLNCSANEIRFGRDQHGHEVVASPSTDLTFSVDHADYVAVLAVGFRSDLGVAIGAISGTTPETGEVRTALTPDEYDRFDRAITPERVFRQYLARKRALARHNGKSGDGSTMIDTSGLSPVVIAGTEITDLKLGDLVVASVAAAEGASLNLTYDDTAFNQPHRSVSNRVDALLGPAALSPFLTTVGESGQRVASGP